MIRTVAETGSTNDDVAALAREGADTKAMLREVHARYLRASEPAQQRQLQKDYFQAMMRFTAATATLGADLGAEANQARNDFVLQLGQDFGSPALVAAAPAASTDPRH